MHRLLMLLALLGIFTLGCSPAPDATPTETETTEPAGGDEAGSDTAQGSETTEDAGEEAP